ncbi:asparagine--tRNA ligase, chloroplastic/mitochondrial isoform X2 [Fagus crenata]
MAAAIAPATPLRLKSYSALRYLSLYTKPNPNYLPNSTQSLTFPPFLHRAAPFSGAGVVLPRRRFFCTIVSGALQSGEAVERTKPEFSEKWRGEAGEKIGEFRKKLRIAVIKGGPDEGLGRVGQTLVATGWVRTLRVQSSVTFIEVNDGSCLSNMQCVIDSDAEGYDQVETGSIATGASVWVQGILVASQGSKQKVELKGEKKLTISCVMCLVDGSLFEASEHCMMNLQRLSLKI